MSSSEYLLHSGTPGHPSVHRTVAWLYSYEWGDAAVPNTAGSQGFAVQVRTAKGIHPKQAAAPSFLGLVGVTEIGLILIIK